MTDAELAAYLGIDDDPRWPKVIARLDPQRRAGYERMYEVEQALNRGEISAGVIVCREYRA